MSPGQRVREKVALDTTSRQVPSYALIRFNEGNMDTRIPVSVITLRVPVSLAESMKADAKQKGQPVNTWLVRAIEHALSKPARQSPARSTSRCG